MGSQSISRDLARFAYNLSFADLPNEITSRAKGCILDGLATAIAGRDLPVPRVALDLVKNSKGKATIFTHDLSVPAIDAAFVNALLINGMSQDDFAYKSHPGAITIPAAIAIAEEEGSSGADVITSVVIGYDIMGRIYLGGPTMLPSFRATGVTGTIGAAATAGKLLKLNESQLTNTLGCAAVFSSGFGEGFLSGTMEAKLNVGMSSRNGVTAAVLAKKGATASEKSLEGESGFYQAFARTTEGLNAATADLGKRFLLNDVIYKEYPACIFLQTPISLALSLVEQNNIKGNAVDKVIVTVPESTFHNPGFRNAGPFTTHLQAAVSARFCIAAALLAKPVTAYSFFDNYNEPEVLELAERIDLIGEKGGDKVSIEVLMRDGKQYGIEGIEGETLVPTTDKIKAKFERLASGFLGEKKTAKVIDIVLNLDQVDKIQELTYELR